MKKHLWIGLLGLLALLPVMSNATPITVSVTGTVLNSRDDTNYFGLGAGSNTLLGASISATWTFDTDDAGVDLNSDPEIADYRPNWPNGEWIDSTINIDTSTVDSTLTPEDVITDENQNLDRVYIQDEDGGSGGFDRYYIIDRDYDNSQRQVFSWAQIYSYVDNLVTSFDTGQLISWNASDSANDWGFGNFYYRDTEADPDIFSTISYELETFTIAASSVPEPSVVSLFALGLLSVSLQRRRRRQMAM